MLSQEFSPSCMFAPNMAKRAQTSRKSTGVKAMRMMLAARQGSSAHKPASKPVQALVPSKPKISKPKATEGLGVLVQQWATAQQLRTGVRWKALDDKAVRTVTTVKRAVALGVPRTVAPRVVAKIRGML